MKEGIHPVYREVLFRDMTPGVDFEFITRSTIQTKETAEKDGKTYPLVKMDTSSASHNFYTGEQRIMDTAGRVDKFRQKFGKRAGGFAGIRSRKAAIRDHGGPDRKSGAQNGDGHSRHRRQCVNGIPVGLQR